MSGLESTGVWAVAHCTILVDPGGGPLSASGLMLGGAGAEGAENRHIAQGLSQWDDAAHPAGTGLVPPHHGAANADF